MEYIDSHDICTNCGKPRESHYCKECKYSTKEMVLMIGGDEYFAPNVCCGWEGLDAVNNLAGRLIGFSCRTCENFIGREDAFYYYKDMEIVRYDICGRNYG